MSQTLATTKQIKDLGSNTALNVVLANVSALTNTAVQSITAANVANLNVVVAGTNVSIDLVQVPSNVAIVSDQFLATANQTVFNLTTTPNNANYIIVTRNGIVQPPGNSYTLNANVVTFTSNCNANDFVEFREISKGGAIGPTGATGANGSPGTPGGATGATGIQGPATLYNNVVSNTLSVTQNNWAPTGFNSNTNLIVLSLPNGNSTITGISNVNVTIGLPILLYNSDSANSVLFVNQSNNSTNANQLYCPGSANAQLGPQTTISILLINTGTSNIWVFK